MPARTFASMRSASSALAPSVAIAMALTRVTT
jgi:hypothetical protein